MTAAQASICLLRFQNLIDSWRADRLTLQLTLRTTFTLTSGTSTVTLGPTGGTVTMARPVWVDSLAYLIPGATDDTEVGLAPMTVEAYQALSIKELGSSLPTMYFYQQQIDTVLGALFIYPQVTQNVTMALYTPKAVAVPAGLTDTMLGPPGYQDAFMYQLALRLCNPFGVSPPPTLPELSTRAMDKVRSQNVAPALLGMDPAVTWRSNIVKYDVYSDTGG